MYVGRYVPVSNVHYRSDYTSHAYLLLLQRHAWHDVKVVAAETT